MTQAEELESLRIEIARRNESLAILEKELEQALNHLDACQREANMLRRENQALCQIIERYGKSEQGIS